MLRRSRVMRCYRSPQVSNRYENVHRHFYGRSTAPVRAAATVPLTPSAATGSDQTIATPRLPFRPVQKRPAGTRQNAVAAQRRASRRPQLPFRPAPKRPRGHDRPSPAVWKRPTGSNRLTRGRRGLPGPALFARRFYRPLLSLRKYSATASVYPGATRSLPPLRTCPVSDSSICRRRRTSRASSFGRISRLMR